MKKWPPGKAKLKSVTLSVWSINSHWQIIVASGQKPGWVGPWMCGGITSSQGAAIRLDIPLYRNCSKSPHFSDTLLG